MGVCRLFFLSEQEMLKIPGIYEKWGIIRGKKVLRHTYKLLHKHTHRRAKP
jgi:hypothetical protein